MSQDLGHPVRKDTFDLREKIISADETNVHAHAEAAHFMNTDDEEHSMLEDDSEGEEHDVDYLDEDDDGSSSLSIPNESIDFDLVYSLHSFAATVEGQANVVKGDSLFLMDDSNSYWWLVRVLKTQEVGYIPAENIETPFERLARLNKHRNIDLASATQAELQEDVHASRDRFRNNLSSRTGSNQSHSPILRNLDSQFANRQSKGVAFTPALSVHRYPPAVWNEEEEEDEEDVEWSDEGYEAEDLSLADEQKIQQREAEGAMGLSMEPDDGMGWDDMAAEEMQARQARERAAAQQALHTSSGLSRPGQTQGQQDDQLLTQQRQQHRTVVQQPQHLRSQTSHEQLVGAPDVNGAPSARQIDITQVTETRKLTVTPNILRDEQAGPLLPSELMQKQEEERKRTREEIEALEESARKKGKGKESLSNPVATNSAVPAASAATVKPAPTAAANKLRKERDVEEDGSKKKKTSVFGGLFGRKKDKRSLSSIGSIDSIGDRESEDSSRSSARPTASVEGNTAQAVVDIAQAPQQTGRNSTDPKRPVLEQEEDQQLVVLRQQQQQQQERQAPPPIETSPSTPPQVSQHTSQLRQRDQHQQALYQQYLNRSPSSPPDKDASYGLQTASAVISNTYSTPSGLGPPGSRPRPGSLILSPSSIEGQGLGIVPELSVIRVFAGKNLQTEATFKTVLLNSLTTSQELVRQAIQRFRLPAGEEEGDGGEYFLTIKQVEGSSAVLLPGEKPLAVFESLVVEAAFEVPKVKRSSVGSISSVASNLSMHPAIKKLSMNDFTDDSAVKFYLNRRGEDGGNDSLLDHDGDITLLAESTYGDHESPRKQQFLDVSPAYGGSSSGSSSNSNVTPERFSSPSFRFTLQVIIHPEDLPDDMLFDPMTEAIVFKHTLRDRSHSQSSGVSLNYRRKVFTLPKNVTVAEVIELALERFGIVDGVVDGGDEVEDKSMKRGSALMVRYGLSIELGTQEKELGPSGKVIDAFPRPPALKAVDRHSNSKRRSVDSAQLLGSVEDVNPDDPIFVLRRAVSYRNSSARHKTPLDEIALQHLHRESSSSDAELRQPSKQEIIAAQRAASRANQRAILSAQSNSVRGVDVLLPGNAMIRSARHEAGDRMRYSYVQPDGETYDISDIIEEEWSEPGPAPKNDLLEGVLQRNKSGLSEKLDRVLSRVKDSKPNARGVTHSGSSSTTASSSLRDSSSSAYSIEDEGHAPRVATPNVASLGERTPTPSRPQRATSPSASAPSRAISPRGQPTPEPRPRTNTPTTTTTSSQPKKPVLPPTRRQPSIGSVMSSYSTYATPTGELSSPASSPFGGVVGGPRRRLIVPRDDFGMSELTALIALGAERAPKARVGPLDRVDELLFGRPLELGTLHPQIRDIYAGSFEKLADMDDALDNFLMQTMSGFSS